MVQYRVIISEEAAVMAQAMARQPARDTRVRRLVLVLHAQASRVVRCHYTEEFLREASQTETA
jgi:hypothetical protein